MSKTLFYLKISDIIKKDYKTFAKKDAQNQGVKNLLKGNKYNDKTALREKQRIFKTKLFGTANIYKFYTTLYHKVLNFKKNLPDYRQVLLLILLEN